MRAKEIPSFEEAVPLNVTPYTRIAQYYETDQMGIIHHAEYVHWMEEARVDIMEQIGFGYVEMESIGVYCPVLGVTTEYRSMVRFYDKVLIECRIAEYTGLKLTIVYRMTDLTTGQICTEGSSRHGFLDKDGNIISLKRKYPDIHRRIQNAMITEA
jgi:acyl-CoA thioester hydrolase